MNKWLQKFMEKPDNTDISDKWDGNLEKRPGEGPDKPDRLDPSLNLSGLSGRPRGLLEEKVENMSEIKPDITDNTDKPDISDKTISGSYLSDLSGFSNELSGNMPFYFPKGSGLRNEYEERLAIAEYDGHQTTTQAERIAYMDAFVSVLVTLPYDETEGDWMGHRIKSAQAWLLDQSLRTPK